MTFAQRRHRLKTHFSQNVSPSLGENMAVVGYTI